MPKIKAEFKVDLADIFLAKGLSLDMVNNSVMDAEFKKITHKTVVINDENGTTAVAGTAVSFVKSIPKLK